MAASLLTGMALVASAAETDAAQACRSDVIKLCRSVKPGGGRMLGCLQQHQTELTPACKTQLPMLVTCGNEIRQLCGDGDPKALRSCAQSHVAELSAECKALAAAH